MMTPTPRTVAAVKGMQRVNDRLYVLEMHARGIANRRANGYRGPLTRAELNRRTS
jgi:hypothetical protein